MGMEKKMGMVRAFVGEQRLRDYLNAEKNSFCLDLSEKEFQALESIKRDTDLDSAVGKIVRYLDSCRSLIDKLNATVEYAEHHVVQLEDHITALHEVKTPELLRVKGL